MNAIAALTLSQSLFVQLPDRPRFVPAESMMLDAVEENLERNQLNHQSSVNSVAFSPDSKTLASSSADKTIKLWNAVTGEAIRTLQGHKGSIWGVSFSPDGKTLATGSEDSTIKLWNAVTGKAIYTLQGHEEAVLSVSFSPDGKTLASGSADKTIKLWNTSWQSWLSSACKQLQYHPILTHPTTDVAREARENCKPYFQ